jgi:biotin transporter BioY
MVVVAVLVESGATQVPVTVTVQPLAVMLAGAV